VAVSSRKSLALLAYLALQPTRSESRERIAALLWSDSGGEHGRGALRQTLRRLKQDLDGAEALVEADRSTLRLTAPVRLDIAEAIETAGRGEAPALLAGEGADLGLLFADLIDLDSDFNLWIAVQRERLRAQLVERLEAALADNASPERNVAVAEALLRSDPTHEGACRAAMQAHLELGDTAQAMRLYERLWQVLDEELDVEQSEKTQGLYVAIKQGQARPAAGGSPVAQTELLAPIAIVVEPAQTRLLDPDFEYFGLIFRDEMIAALSRFRDWLVVDGAEGSTSPPAYRAYSLRIMMHGREDSITVGLRLVDQRTSQCIWAERYPATLDTMTSLHRTALRHLAVALNVHLSGPRLQSAREAQGPSGRKYELWMQAQALCLEWRAEADAKAEAILRQLVAAHPTFAQAMVALAQIINARPIVFPGKRHRRDLLAESQALTARAVSLDPLDSRSHLCRSWSHAISGAHMAALSHLDLSLDLNENDPWTVISAALGFAFAGELDRSRGLVRQAQSFGMRHSRAAQGYIATAAYLTGEYEAAVAAAEVAGDAIINLPAWQAASAMQLGDREGAAMAMTRFLELTRSGWFGDGEASDEAVLDWFIGCFPIRSEAVRAELRRQLERALAERAKRRLR
jgi:DNA-binding SARP family transcriptional activator